MDRAESGSVGVPLGASETRWPIVAREGWPVVGAIAIVCIALTFLAWWAHWSAGLVAGVISAALIAWGLWFFRDPARTPPEGPGLVVSGADGVVCFVGAGAPPAELGLSEPETAGMTRVSVFMNIFNVHVNRAPMEGVVERLTYRAGAFFNASLDKASDRNERQALLLRTRDGRAVAVVQIAGLIARRIVCRVKHGQRLATGERFGLIRFGSRVDHYLPAGVEALVRVGDITRAGETLIARLGGADA